MAILQPGDTDGNTKTHTDLDTTGEVIDNFLLQKNEAQKTTNTYEFATRDEMIQKQSEILEKMRDPLFLPTSQEIYIASREDKRSCNSYVENLTKDDAAYKGHYLILNKEFIDIFSDYLANSVVDLIRQGQQQPIKILEVGAGNGRLTYFLKQALERKIPGKFSIIATDSGDWSSIVQDFAVERKDAISAVKEIQPDIVIASFVSWMSEKKNDRTPNAQDAPYIKEYILIGPEGQGWEHSGHKTPPGFTKRSLSKITETQTCLHDKVEWKDLNTISRIKSERGTLSYKKNIDGKPPFVIKKL